MDAVDQMSGSLTEATACMHLCVFTLLVVGQADGNSLALSLREEPGGLRRGRENDNNENAEEHRDGAIDQEEVLDKYNVSIRPEIRVLDEQTFQFAKLPEM